MYLLYVGRIFANSKYMIPALLCNRLSTYQSNSKALTIKLRRGGSRNNDKMKPDWYSKFQKEGMSRDDFIMVGYIFSDITNMHRL